MRTVRRFRQLFVPSLPVEGRLVVCYYQDNAVKIAGWRPSFPSIPCRETDRRPATYGHGQFACRFLKSLARKQVKVLQTSILFPLARVSRVCMSELSAGFESEARGIFGLPLGVLVRDLKFGIAPAHLCSNSIWHCPPTRAKCAFVSRVPSSREYPTVSSDRLPHSSAGECCSFLRHL